MKKTIALLVGICLTGSSFAGNDNRKDENPDNDKKKQEIVGVMIAQAQANSNSNSVEIPGRKSSNDGSGVSPFGSLSTSPASPALLPRPCTKDTRDQMKPLPPASM